MTVGELSRELTALRIEFEGLVDELRPELHRYCARILASPADGEDTVQEALAEAYYRLPTQAGQLPLRLWLFSIAHRRCVARLSQAPVSGDADLLGELKAAAALNEVYAMLPPAERVALVMKDVLDFPLDKIAALLGVHVGAVKSALHRAREKLDRVKVRRRPSLSPDNGHALCDRYAAAMRRRDAAGLRQLLAGTVRVELVGRRLIDGRDRIMQDYVSPELAMSGAFRFETVQINGRRHLLRVQDDGGMAAPHSLLSLDCHQDAIYEIRDYFHVPYLIESMDFSDHVSPLPAAPLNPVARSIPS